MDNTTIEDNTQDNNIDEKETKSPPKMSVSSGDFDTQEHKIRFNKQLILGYLSKGITKKASASMAGVTEQTFYNYCKEDLDFKKRVDACLGGEDKIQALVNISQAVKEGDLEASKYLLNKTRHYEKRYDPKWMDPSMIETTKNPVTEIFEVITDMDDIAGSLLGESFAMDQESALDEMEQVLMVHDEQAKGVITELMDDENVGE